LVVVEINQSNSLFTSVRASCSVLNCKSQLCTRGTPKPRYCFAKIGLEHTRKVSLNQWCSTRKLPRGQATAYAFPPGLLRSLGAAASSLPTIQSAAALSRKPCTKARKTPFTSNYPASLMPSDAFPPVHRASQSAAAVGIRPPGLYHARSIHYLPSQVGVKPHSVVGVALLPCLPSYVLWRAQTPNFRLPYQPISIGTAMIL